MNTNCVYIDNKEPARPFYPLDVDIEQGKNYKYVYEPLVKDLKLIYPSVGYLNNVITICLEIDGKSIDLNISFGFVLEGPKSKIKFAFIIYTTIYNTFNGLTDLYRVYASDIDFSNKVYLFNPNFVNNSWSYAFWTGASAGSTTAPPATNNVTSLTYYMSSAHNPGVVSIYQLISSTTAKSNDIATYYTISEYFYSCNKQEILNKLTSVINDFISKPKARNLYYNNAVPVEFRINSNFIQPAR